MRSTVKMNEIDPPKSVKLLTLDCETLGKLIRAKALEAVAMHFLAVGLGEREHTTSSGNHHILEDAS